MNYAYGEDDGNFKKGRFKPIAIILVVVTILGGGALLAFGGLSLIREAAQRAEAAGAKVEQSLGLAYVVVLLTGVGAFLLIASGVGYLKQSKFMGRTLGTVYALVSLGGTALGVINGGGIGVFTIIFSVYPVLTLIMVNTTFKDDLVN